MGVFHKIIDRHLNMPMIIFWGAVFYLLNKMVIRFLIPTAFGSPEELMVLLDNDSVLRFVSIRQWLAGQGWYDMHIERFAPPYGLDLHWSRYVDVGIATFIWAFQPIFGINTAEFLAIIIWPTLFLVGFCIASAYAAWRLFGPIAAGVSIFVSIESYAIGKSYFNPGQLDHHNLQIFLCLVMIVTLILPGSEIRKGVLAGVCAALSLAIGLELLITIALVGIILYCDVLRQKINAPRKLLAFSIALGTVAPPLFALQTPISRWDVVTCDVLSPPYLAITTVAAVISIITVWGYAMFTRTGQRITVVLGCGILAMIGFGVMLNYCPAGPYSNVPADVVEIINHNIVETRSVFLGLLDGKVSSFGFVIPSAITIVLSIAFLIIWSTRKTSNDFSKYSFVILLIFACLGTVGSVIQLRLNVIGMAAMPLLMGGVVSALYAPAKITTDKRIARNAQRITAFAMLFLIGSPSIFSFMKDSWMNFVQNEAYIDENLSSCNAFEDYTVIRSLPQARIMAGGDVAIKLLLLTDHFIMAGPYHRNPQAFRDYILPFADGQRQTMEEALVRTQSDYLVVCENRKGPEGAFLSDLVARKEVEGFTLIEEVKAPLALYRFEAQ